MLRALATPVKSFWLVKKARIEIKSVGERVPSSTYPPVVARMRKFLRVGSLTLQVLSGTQLFVPPLKELAGGPVCRKVPKRPATARFRLLTLIPFPLLKLSLKSHGGGLTTGEVCGRPGGALHVNWSRAPNMKIKTNVTIGAFFILLFTVSSSPQDPRQLVPWIPE